MYDDRIWFDQYFAELAPFAELEDLTLRHYSACPICGGPCDVGARRILPGGFVHTACEEEAERQLREAAQRREDVDAEEPSRVQRMIDAKGNSPKEIDPEWRAELKRREQECPTPGAAPVAGTGLTHRQRCGLRHTWS